MRLFYGSGVKIAPDAIVDDGVLDVCIVADVSRWTVLRMFFARVFRRSCWSFGCARCADENFAD